MKQFLTVVIFVIGASFLTASMLGFFGLTDEDTIFDIVVGITALAIFGPPLWNWIKSFSKGTNSTEKD